MKKIILIASLLNVGVALAQQKDVFDFEKHFQKNRAKPTTNTRQFLSLKPTFPVNDSYRTLNGNTVRILPGNMPCVIPDTKQFNMPNIATTPAYSEAYKERYGMDGFRKLFLPERIIQ